MTQIDIRSGNAVEEVQNLIKKLDVVEVNVNVLFNMLSQFKQLKKAYEKLKNKKMSMFASNPMIRTSSLVSTNKEVMSLTEYCRTAGIGRHRLYYAIEKKYINATRLGEREYLINVQEVNSYFENKI